MYTIFYEFFKNHLQWLLITWVTLKIMFLIFFSENIITIFQKSWNLFSYYVRVNYLRYQKYKNKKLNNSTLELQNDFIPIKWFY